MPADQQLGAGADEPVDGEHHARREEGPEPARARRPTRIGPLAVTSTWRASTTLSNRPAAMAATVGHDARRQSAWDHVGVRREAVRRAARGRASATRAARCRRTAPAGPTWS